MKTQGNERLLGLRPEVATDVRRWSGQAAHRSRRSGFSLLECLVYISVLTVTLTLAYPAFYRAMKASRDLRRNADDIERALHAGERWRADVRLVKAAPRLEGGALIIPQAAGAVVYSFEAGAVWRNDGRSKVRVLRDVKASRMENAEGKPSAPGNVAIGERRSIWRWELELASPEPVVRVRPLFTFQAVEGAAR